MLIDQSAEGQIMLSCAHGKPYSDAIKNNLKDYPKKYFHLGEYYLLPGVIQSLSIGGQLLMEEAKIKNNDRSEFIVKGWKEKEITVLLKILDDFQDEGTVNDSSAQEKERGFLSKAFNSSYLHGKETYLDDNLANARNQIRKMTREPVIYSDALTKEEKLAALEKIYAVKTGKGSGVWKLFYPHADIRGVKTVVFSEFTSKESHKSYIDAELKFVEYFFKPETKGNSNRKSDLEPVGSMQDAQNSVLEAKKTRKTEKERYIPGDLWKYRTTQPNSIRDCIYQCYRMVVTYIIDGEKRKEPDGVFWEKNGVNETYRDFADYKEKDVNGKLNQIKDQIKKKHSEFQKQNSGDSRNGIYKDFRNKFGIS